MGDFFEKMKKSQALRAYLMMTPFIMVAILLLLVPMLTVAEKSFHPIDEDFTVLRQLTLDNYHRVLSPQYFPVFVRTLGYAFITTILCLAMGYPMAYFVATYGGKRKNFFLLLIMLPFWTSYLIRTYAWIVILRAEGLLNSFLLGLHVVSEPVGFLNTPFAVILGLTYGFLPFMTLPIYVSLEKLDRSLVEASMDLGASPARAFFNVILPLSLPGVVAGSLLTFIPCVGDFVTADILGGPETTMIGNLIQGQFLDSFDWPFGSALSFVLMAFMLFSIYFYSRIVGHGKA
jgi:spermidine/putrescine transport system permease protein